MRDPGLGSEAGAGSHQEEPLGLWGRGRGRGISWKRDVPAGNGKGCGAEGAEATASGAWGVCRGPGAACADGGPPSCQALSASGPPLMSHLCGDSGRSADGPRPQSVSLGTSLWSSGQKVEAEGPRRCPGRPVSAAVGAAGGRTLDSARSPSGAGWTQAGGWRDQPSPRFFLRRRSERPRVRRPDSPAVRGLRRWLPLSFSICTCVFLHLQRSGSHPDPRPQMSRGASAREKDVLPYNLRAVGAPQEIDSERASGPRAAPPPVPTSSTWFQFRIQDPSQALRVALGASSLQSLCPEPSPASFYLSWPRCTGASWPVVV